MTLRLRGRRGDRLPPPDRRWLGQAAMMQLILCLLVAWLYARLADRNEDAS